MFARTSAAMFILSVLPIFAAAGAVHHSGGPPPPPIPANQCNTSDLSCCNSVQSSDNLDGPAHLLLGLLGINVGDLTGLVGITCTPISIVGIGGNSCSAQPVCCTDNQFNGIVNLGCTPVNLNV